MTDGDDRSDRATPDALNDAFGGPSRSSEQFSTGDHGVVRGDDDVAFDLESCELVAQSFDTESGVGTRLYRVEGDTFALSQYRRSVSQEWSENLLTHGTLTVEPVELDAATLREGVDDHGAPPLTDDQLEHVRDTYATVSREAIRQAIDAPGTDDGPVVRRQLACVEDHAWRETLEPRLAEGLVEGQTGAVLDALMDARPEVDWTWCRLYAVYLARLDFE